MGKFVKGSVVVLPFPFSDLHSTKRRPALVIAELDGYDVILCQITTRSIRDRYSISLKGKDFTSGSLRKDSNIRPNRLFTADSNIILYQAGRLTSTKVGEVIEGIINIIT